MFQVFSSLDHITFQKAKSLLQSKEVLFITKNESLNGQAAGEVPPLVCWPEIWVKDEETAKLAARLLKRVNLRVESGEEWTCQSCGEVLEGQFTHCWNCGEEKSQL